jgi:hypothetical protein
MARLWGNIARRILAAALSVVHSAAKPMTCPRLMMYRFKLHETFDVHAIQKGLSD